MDNIVTRQLDDEYELAQLNPVYSQTADGQAEAQSQSKKLDEMPETVNMKFRKAVFEAIVDDLVETKIEQIEEQQLAQNPNTDEQPLVVDAKEVEAEVAPVVDDTEFDFDDDVTATATAEPEPEIVIEDDSKQWIVYATDERASKVTGSEKVFDSEEDALDNFVKRLRALNVLRGQDKIL